MELKIKLEGDFSKIKEKYNKYSEANYDKDVNPVIGFLWWSKPEDVIWLYATDNEEDYEGEQTQLGINRDGTIVWAYFSHCSCYYYDEYDGEREIFESFKQIELSNVDKDILSILESRIKLINERERDDLK